MIHALTCRKTPRVTAGGLIEAGCSDFRGQPFSRSASSQRTQSVARPRVHASSMTTLVSFDVDGTLIESVGTDANALHKEAFSHAFKSVFGIDTHIDVIKHHGSTDPLVLAAVMLHHGVPRDQVMERLGDMEAAMLEHYTANKHRAGDGLQLLPGVHELLTRLQGMDSVLVCLVTGNLEPIAWAKMDAVGIGSLFSGSPRFGGFGSDYCSGDTSTTWRDRSQLIRIARQKATSHPRSLDGGIVAAYHVGDTPMDMLAAHDAESTPIGVTTGVYTAAELDAAVPGAKVLANLQDVDAVLDTMQLLRKA